MFLPHQLAGFREAQRRLCNLKKRSSSYCSFIADMQPKIHACCGAKLIQRNKNSTHLIRVPRLAMLFLRHTICLWANALRRNWPPCCQVDRRGISPFTVDLPRRSVMSVSYDSWLTGGVCHISCLRGCRGVGGSGGGAGGRRLSQRRHPVDSNGSSPTSGTAVSRETCATAGSGGAIDAINALDLSLWCAVPRCNGRATISRWCRRPDVPFRGRLPDRVGEVPRP